MKTLPPGTLLLEENSIRYQIYSDEYYESTFENVLESRMVKGSIYSDFGVDESVIKNGCKEYIKNSVNRIIAIDTSQDRHAVVGSIFGEDFVDFVKSQMTDSRDKNLQILKYVNRQLIKPLLNLPIQKGEIIIGSGFAVKKEYQDLKIGKNLINLFLRIGKYSNFKIQCGLFYSRKASHILMKQGGFILCSLQPENCKDIDNTITKYMKNYVEIVAFVDPNISSSQFDSIKFLLNPVPQQML
ncbi:hypothetical protein TTHERM_00277240 (macronuclear) [Tetrahymena thermophila SB210]|uniref:N-acetyltransferase domain-containing protein n=1 Tax=Tetrahymena thermophila (strain SB210) TaxID=312017 RepID=I7MK83_TETTS|nr:hypothetical protein TTHERM_00277240 [Tetrahymena thermophila SB210]EAR97839.1 hypothetical protein TTHERM_00277240 [Tetrahymena thermophila SB210]|eukprot:XP_001018084.1 hypothetical protein TTHERM_00277240 [Tetrahymena thermophila SB210]